MQIKIPVPPEFSFRRTVLSHGWCELLPFEFDQDAWILTRVFDTGGEKPLTAAICEGKNALKVEVNGEKPSRAEQTRLTRDIRHIFRLDDNLEEFYALTDTDENLSWVSRAGAGRLLRGPNVFEDLVKTICTTNCSWAMTKKMVAGLVTLGAEAPDGRRAFPTPAQLAAQPETFYREVVRAGYRAPYFPELAQRVLNGEIDAESWLNRELPEAKLKRAMKQVKGVGDYAAENLLKLVGNYEGLTLDSWVRPQFYNLRNNGQPCDDKEIATHYERYGAWRGLALWCDVTHKWLEDERES